MKRMLFLIPVGLLLLTAVDVARANSVTANETFFASGTASQTSPCCSTDGFTGLFTVGTMIANTTDWTVIAGKFVPQKGHCGASDCSALVWNVSLEFDASNDTLFGTASADFTGKGGDSRQYVLTFIDGNKTTDPFQNNDLTTPANSRSGTIAYTVSVATVPEPSTLLLMSSGAFGIFGVMRRRFRA